MARPAIRLPMWLIPMLYVCVTIAAVLILPRLEHAWLPGYSHDMSAASAQAMLGAIASGMMALVGMVFALAFLMVQFSALAYSPRLVVWLSHDPVMFNALGIFNATFCYALGTLAWIDRDGDGRVPLFSMLVVLSLLIVSMLAFARLVQRLNDIQITNVLRFVGRQGRQVIAAMFPRLDEALPGTPDSWSQAARETGKSPVTLALRHGGEPWAVAGFDIGTLVHAAETADAVIVVHCAVGDRVLEGSPLLSVHGGTGRLDERLLRRAVVLARERTFEQDPKFPLRLLVDIAIRALSPAINDPTTAVQAIDQIEDLLRRLVICRLDTGCVSDAHGRLRLVFPTPGWEDYLTLAFDEIRRYGAGSVQVTRRLRAALRGLAVVAVDPGRRAGVERYLAHLDATVGRSELDGEDRLRALEEDAQGLGLSRGGSGR